MFPMGDEKCHRTFILTLCVAQAVFCFVSFATLVLTNTDGRWLWMLGVFATALGAVECMVFISSRSKGVCGKELDLLIISCVIMSVGIVGLVSDIETKERTDERSVGGTKRGLWLLIVAWGLLLLRVGAGAVEGDARVESRSNISISAH